MSERLIKTPIRYYFIIIDYGIKKNKTMLVDIFEMMPDNPRPKNDFNNWENVPSMGFQARRKGTDKKKYVKM